MAYEYNPYRYGNFSDRQNQQDTPGGLYDVYDEFEPAPIPAEQEQNILADFMDKLQQGAFTAAADIITGARGLLTDDKLWTMEKSLRDRAAAQEETLSSAQREADANFSPFDDGGFSARGAMGAFASGLGSIAPFMLAGGVASAAGRGIAGLAGVTSEAGLTAGAATGSAAVGAPAIGGAAMHDAEQQIANMSPEDLAQIPDFSEYYNAAMQNSPDNPQAAMQSAREAYSADAQETAVRQGAGLGAVSMGVAGPFLERMMFGGLGALKGAQTGAATEFVQEGVESGGQRAIVNPLVGQDVSEGVLEEAATGAILGGLVGAPVGAVSGAMSRKPEEEEKEEVPQVPGLEQFNTATNQKTETYGPPNEEGILREAEEALGINQFDTAINPKDEGNIRGWSPRTEADMLAEADAVLGQGQDTGYVGADGLSIAQNQDQVPGFPGGAQQWMPESQVGVSEDVTEVDNGYNENQRDWAARVGPKEYEKPPNELIGRLDELKGHDAAGRKEILSGYKNRELSDLAYVLGVARTGTKEKIINGISRELEDRNILQDDNKDAKTKRAIADLNYANNVQAIEDSGETLGRAAREGRARVRNTKQYREMGDQGVDERLTRQDEKNARALAEEMAEEVQNEHKFVGENSSGDRLYEKEDGTRYILDGAKEDTRMQYNPDLNYWKTKDEREQKKSEPVWENQLKEKGSLRDIEYGDHTQQNEEDKKVIALSTAVDLMSPRKKGGIKDKEQYSRLVDYYNDPANIKAAIQGAAGIDRNSAEFTQSVIDRFEDQDNQTEKKERKGKENLWQGTKMPEDVELPDGTKATIDHTAGTLMDGINERIAEAKQLRACIVS